MALLEDLGELRDLHDAAVLRRNGDAAGSLGERCASYVERTRVEHAFREASTAPEDRAGEPVRRRFRAVVGPYLERSSEEPLAELAKRLDSAPIPEGGFELALAAQSDPSERAALAERWQGLEACLAPVRAAVSAARADAARRLGAASVAELLCAGEARSARAVLGEFTRNAIDPLEAAVAAACRRLDRVGDPYSALARLDGSEVGSRRAVAGFLGREIGWDPGTGPASKLREARRLRTERRFSPSDGAVVVLGQRKGVGGLREALAEVGGAARAEFLDSRIGAARRWVDPAFDSGVKTLFGRLVFSEPFLEAAGYPKPGERELGEARLDEAVAPRLAWAYLFLAAESTGPDRDAPAAAEVDETFVRAVARAATPAEVASAGACDPCGASVLRGTVYGLLLEERAMTRFGRGWFADRRAHGWLRECWEAETGETADSVAAALTLGTIEATPLADRCRP